MTLVQSPLVRYPLSHNSNPCHIIPKLFNLHDHQHHPSTPTPSPHIPSTLPPSHSLFNSSALLILSSLLPSTGGTSIPKHQHSGIPPNPQTSPLTTHSHRNLRPLGLKVLRGRLLARAGSVLVVVVFMVAGCGFRGRGGVFGDFFVDVGGGFFFGGEDGHGCLIWLFEMWEGGTERGDG